MHPIQRWSHRCHSGNLSGASGRDTTVRVGEDDIVADAEQRGSAIHRALPHVALESGARRYAGFITRVVCTGHYSTEAAVVRRARQSHLRSGILLSLLDDA